MIVVDTSIAIKWLRSDEERYEAAMSLYKNHIDKREEIIVPNFLYIEAANALATNNVLSPKDIACGMEILFEARLGEYIIKEEDIIEASILANKYKTTVYDMLYAVIAKNKKILLITDDKKFANKVKFPFVKTLLQASS